MHRIPEPELMNEPEQAMAYARADYNSLLAAFTVDEVKQQLLESGLAHLSVCAISDRHLMVKGIH